MEKPFYKSHFDISILGIRTQFETTPGGYHPLHWHEEIELLYPLNGDIHLKVDNKKCIIRQNQFAVIESCQVHSTFHPNKATMFVCIHITKKALESYLPNIDLYRIHCLPDAISEGQQEEYEKICLLLQNLTRFYMENTITYNIDAEGILLLVVGHLLRNFSTVTTRQFSDMGHLTRERIQTVITYVDQHYAEPITLQEICDELSLGKEYFCRFFKKNMNISFLNYLNEIRLSHAYQDLQTTDLSIAEIMEQNGLTNQKLFNKTFKEQYGCTPSEVRKA